jgi:hypothetical protein
MRSFPEGAKTHESIALMNARELSNRLAELLQKERHALAAFLIALSDFDRERRWVDLGHSSLFNYLHRDLGLSRGAAFYRASAAQLIQRHPEVVEPLRDGRLCFTSVVELAKVATSENIGTLLPRFFHLSKSEAKEVSAELNPEPAPVRTVVSPARARAPAPTLDLSLARAELAPPALAPVDSGQTVHPGELANATAPRQPGISIEAKNAEQSRMHLTVPRRLLAKLEAARAALSHSHPGASEAEIIEAGLDLLLDQSAKRKGLVKRPRHVASSQPDACESEGGSSRYVPAAIRRAVWKRDGGRCQHPLERGGVCGSTLRVQLHHIVPWAQGGPTTVANLRCACAFHNDLAAREAFGDEVMDRFTRGPSRVKEAIAPYGAGPYVSRFSGSRS